MRIFIAIEIPETVRNAVADRQAEQEFEQTMRLNGIIAAAGLKGIVRAVPKGVKHA